MGENWGAVKKIWKHIHWAICKEPFTLVSIVVIIWGKNGELHYVCPHKYQWANVIIYHLMFPLSPVCVMDVLSPIVSLHQHHHADILLPRPCLLPCLHVNWNWPLTHIIPLTLSSSVLPYKYHLWKKNSNLIFPVWTSSIKQPNYEGSLSSWSETFCSC